MEGPWLTTTGKKKGKKRWATAEQKAKAEQLKESWAELQAKWAPKTKVKDVKRAAAFGPKYPPGREPAPINSVDTGWVACTKPADKEYTGTKCKGIGTMHKSNAVPIFSDEEAVDISKMRR